MLPTTGDAGAFEPMVVLRCTQKLLDCGVLQTADPTAQSDSLLGDWYANVLHARPQRLVLCVSERTLLPIVLPLKPAATLPFRLAEAVADVLSGLGIGTDQIQAEVSQMRPCVVGKTASRRILGTLNGFMFQLKLGQRLDSHWSHRDHALWLARTPCLTLEGTFPDQVTRVLFAGSAR